MGHMVRINGENKTIKKGLVMVDGVVKEIVKGMVMVDGIRKELKLDQIIPRTMTFTGYTYLSAFTVECFGAGGVKRGVGNTAEHTLTDGQRIVVSCGLSTDYLDSNHSNYREVVSYIVLDGETVAQGKNRIDYELDVHSDLNIYCKVNDTESTSTLYVKMEIEQRGDS